MPISIRLEPELEKLLEALCKREHKTKTEIIHYALRQVLVPKKSAAQTIKEALREIEPGFHIERNQPMKSDERDW